MSNTLFQRMALGSKSPLALPISTYPGLAITGARVSDVVTSAQAQFNAQAALRQRYSSPFVLAAMDLSAEAEAFGCRIAVSDTEVPTVMGRLVTNQQEADRLEVPEPGAARTSVYLETVRLLSGMSGSPFVFAGCIGPFSLAARLAGVSEAMELTIAEPELMHTLLEKSTKFLANYVKAFRAAGAHGLIMAEPAAGLLSPRGLASFSSGYIKKIAAHVHDESFSLVLHNCAARLIHLPAIQETGLKAFHFGAPMDIVEALKTVPSDVVLCGNLDPSALFCQGTPRKVAEQTAALLAASKAFSNFVISSGCDLPPGTPLENLDAFYTTVDGTN